jgi:hypothetical protein
LSLLYHGSEEKINAKSMEKDSHYERLPRLRTVTLLAPRSNGLRFIMLAAALIFGGLWILNPGRQWASNEMKPLEGKRVPLEAHIM